MNSFHLMPFEAIAINEVVDSTFPELPGVCGTGFFCHFPPFLQIYYVTARHCLINAELNSADNLRVRHSSSPNEYITFSHYFSTGYTNQNDNELEDILVFKVHDRVTSRQKNALLQAALTLPHQDDVEAHISELQSSKAAKVRVIGFPRGADDANQIDYDSENPQLISQPRGFNGFLQSNNSKLTNRYTIDNSNWKLPSYDGFSGAPVLSMLVPAGVEPSIARKEDIITVPIGVVLTATSHCTNFLSINVVTDLIALAINNEIRNGHD
ncbi:hypothetical protein [Pseudomonas mosselii]|uniref:hypothetical protein n=1 Tax=Pseudomonas mosselii TaxID=78327 RepID=UPI001F4BDAC1|nr:hypothetical protein [Pseudomonas mosselii]MCH7417456.1 hypothetical protein [Pseudomonas mosselii]